MTAETPDAIVLEYEISPNLLRAAMQAGPFQTKSFWTKPAALYSRRTKTLIPVALVPAALGLGLLLGQFNMPLWLLYVVLGFALGNLAGFYLWQLVVVRTVNAYQAEDAKLAKARGSTRLMASPEGLIFESGVAATRLDWVGVSDVVAMPEATLLRSGAMNYPIPNAALPDELTPEAFRDQLADWRSEA